MAIKTAVHNEFSPPLSPGPASQWLTSSFKLRVKAPSCRASTWLHFQLQQKMQVYHNYSGYPEPKTTYN